MSNWTGLDFFIFLIFLFNTLLGMARGASKEIISMMCVSAALIFTIKFVVPLSAFINSSPLITDVIGSHMTQNFMQAIGMPPLTAEMLFRIGYCLSVLICFAGIFCTTEAVLTTTNIVQIFYFPYAALDRKVGAALGCARGYVFTLIFILLYLFLTNAGSDSYFVNLFSSSAAKLNNLITLQAPDRYREVLQDKNLFQAKDVLSNVS